MLTLPKQTPLSTKKILSGLIKQEPIDENYIFTEQWNQDQTRNPFWEEKVKEKVVRLQESEL